MTETLKLFGPDTVLLLIFLIPSALLFFYIRNRNNRISKSQPGLSQPSSQEESQAPKTNESPLRSTSPAASLFSLRGRISRGTFWTIMGCMALVSAFTNLILNSFGESFPLPLLVIILAILFLGLWVILAAHVKRWHDIGHSGAFVLFLFIPFVNFVYVPFAIALLGFRKSICGPNAYGPEPNSAWPEAPASNIQNTSGRQNDAPKPKLVRKQTNQRASSRAEGPTTLFTVRYTDEPQMPDQISAHDRISAGCEFIHRHPRESTGRIRVESGKWLSWSMEEFDVSELTDSDAPSNEANSSQT